MFGLFRPSISVVVVVYRMAREAPRTLLSLTSRYQGVAGRDYEVIVVENRSEQMLSAHQVRRYGRQFRYFVNPVRSRSPAQALNFGARKARGHHLLLLIDGARILSPGILRRTLTAQRLYEEPVVATLAWHLGPDNQARSIHNGYCQQVEDQLLATVNWQEDGYQLFTVSSLAGSCSMSWFFPILESNCIAMSRAHFERLDGYCEDFLTDGGGFVNLDFYKRALADPHRPLVLLLGEGTFHQFHGGAATNRQDDRPLQVFRQEYERLRGQPFAAPQGQPVFLGAMPDEAKPFMRVSVNAAEEQYRQVYPSLAAQSLSTGPSDDLAAAPTDAPRCQTEVSQSKAPAKPRVGHSTRPEPRLADSNSSAPVPRMIAVVGMHRSGTSCLAGTLMECGAHFGDVSRKNPFNAKGNNENRQVMDLHNQLLQENAGSWKSPPPEVCWQAAHRRQRDAIIRQFRMSGEPICGFKDPRTLLALEGWLEALPELELVGIFRHPLAVAQSLTHRNLFTQEQGFQLWLEYNRRLLSVCRQFEFPLLHFSPNPDEFRQDLEGLIDRLRLVPPAAGLQFFESSLQHFRPLPEVDLPAELSDVLEELRQIASAQRLTLRSKAA
jgi:hypothetical protein